jgi:hypothetical protein
VAAQRSAEHAAQVPVGSKRPPRPTWAGLAGGRGPLPGFLGLQRAVGNQAVAGLIQRQTRQELSAGGEAKIRELMMEYQTAGPSGKKKARALVDKLKEFFSTKSGLYDYGKSSFEDFWEEPYDTPAPVSAPTAASSPGAPSAIGPQAAPDLSEAAFRRAGIALIDPAFKYFQGLADGDARAAQLVEKLKGWFTDQSPIYLEAKAQQELGSDPFAALASRDVAPDAADAPGAVAVSASMSEDALAGHIATVLGENATSDRVIGLVKLANASSGEIAAAAELVNKAREKPKPTGSASASGSAATTAVLDADVATKAINFVNGIQASVKLTSKLTATAKGSVQAEVSWSTISAKIAANATMFVGAVADLKGDFKLDAMEGLKASVRAKAGVSASVSASVSAKVDVGELASVEVGVKGKALAAVKASGSAEIEIGPNGVKFAGQISALAGASASVSSNVGITFKGEEALKLGVGAEAIVGVGFKAKGGFKIENGKLTLDANLAAALGVGLGISLHVELDYRLVAQAIADKIAEVYEVWRITSQGFTPLADEDAVRLAARAKANAFKEKRKTNLVKFNNVAALQAWYTEEAKAFGGKTGPDRIRKLALFTEEVAEVFPVEAERLTKVAA